MMLYSFGHVRATILRQDMRTSSICNTRHVTARRNRVAKSAQHIAPNNVVIWCAAMLRSFGRGLKVMLHEPSFNVDF